MLFLLALLAVACCLFCVQSIAVFFVGDPSAQTLSHVSVSCPASTSPLDQSAHKVRMVNCKRRGDFCVDMLGRLHRFDQLQGVRRCIPVKLRRVPADMALDPAQLCFQDEALMRCCQKLVPRSQRVWIDRGLSANFATTDERLSQHTFHKESQNNPGMMVSGVVDMRDGAWLDVMRQHVIPECEAIDNFFMHPGQRPLSCKYPTKAVYEENMPLTQSNVIFQPPTSPDLNLLDTFFWSALQRQLPKQFDEISRQYGRLDKLLTNWRRRLAMCVQQQGGDVFDHLAYQPAHHVRVSRGFLCVGIPPVVHHRVVGDGKESQTEFTIVLHRIRWCWRYAKRMWSAASKCEASNLIIQSAGTLVVEPPVTVRRGLCLAASHDTSYDSLFTVLELSPVKPWLDKHAKESTRKRCVFMCDPSQ